MPHVCVQLCFLRDINAILGTYETTVVLSSNYPPIIGNTINLFCNITKTGYPKQIQRYVWARDNKTLQDSKKCTGTNTDVLNIVVSITYGLPSIT